MKNLMSLCYVMLMMVIFASCGGSKSKENSKFKPQPMAKPLTYEEAVADWKNQNRDYSLLIQ